MSYHAEKCPICGGSGKKIEHPEGYTPTSAEAIIRFCNGCGGKGWVEVRNK